MTADDALKTGLFVSVLLHATLFFGWGDPVRVPLSGGTVVTMELEGSGAVVSDEGGVLLEARAFDPRAADDAKAFEERRRRYLAYLQDVSNEIHARRLEAGGNGLIGICEVRFSIDEAGRFYAVRLRACVRRRVLCAVFLFRQIHIPQKRFFYFFIQISFSQKPFSFPADINDRDY